MNRRFTSYLRRPSRSSGVIPQKRSTTIPTPTDPVIAALDTWFFVFFSKKGDGVYSAPAIDGHRMQPQIIETMKANGGSAELKDGVITVTLTHEHISRICGNSPGVTRFPES